MTLDPGIGTSGVPIVCPSLRAASLVALLSLRWLRIAQASASGHRLDDHLRADGLDDLMLLHADHANARQLTASSRGILHVNHQ